MYWMINLRPLVSHFLWFLLLMVLFNLISGAICLAIAAVAPSVAAANIIAISVILSSSLFGGFLLNKESLPSYLNWIQYLSFWNYAFEALLVNEFDGMKIIINPKALKGYAVPGVGRFILDQFGMSPDRFYVNIVVMISVALFFIVVTGFLIKFFVKERR